MSPAVNVKASVEFFIKNSKTRKKDLDAVTLRGHIMNLEENVENGLDREDLERLAKEVIFHNNFDLTIRRKLLYCLLPSSPSEFPYQIVPIAVSSVTVVPANTSWQYSVLSWLCGLFEYFVIDAHNPYVHICYTSIFNLVVNLTLCHIACKILGYMTRREDVTAARSISLMHAKGKPGFYIKVSSLLRLYQLYRPDYVVGTLSPRNVSITTPKNLKKGLLVLRLKVEEINDENFAATNDKIWPETHKAEKINPHQRPTAIPKPDNTYYTETIEEKTKKVIFVSQYRRFKELVKGIDDWEYWKWPNNSSSLLCAPIIIPMFRPHEPSVLGRVSNWTQLVLRTELVEGMGVPNNERHLNLLKATLALVKVTGTPIPVVDHFIADYMAVWDRQSHFDVVLSLLEFMTFSSPAYISVTLLKLVSELLDQAPLTRWCQVVEVISSTLGTWAISAQKEISKVEELLLWPTSDDEELGEPLVGVWQLVNRMEQIFKLAVIEYDFHPMVFHQIFDFYEKVFLYCNVLNLPAMFMPCVPLTIAVFTQSDIVIVHRLGKLLSRASEDVQRVRRLKSYGGNRDVQTECLSYCSYINLSVRLYLNAVSSRSAFGKHFQEAVEPFYPWELLKKIHSTEEAKRYACITHALPYLPFYAKELVNNTAEADSLKIKQLHAEVLEALSDHGFTGISDCLKTYKK